MAVLTNAAIYYESGQAQQAFTTMTPDAARQTFSSTSKPWSQAVGYEYTVAPYGLATGGEVTPAVSGDDDKIDVAALTAYMPDATGASATTGLLSVNAGYDISLSRGGAGAGYFVNSITVTSSGTVVAVPAASGHASAFSETRGAAGGPPLIPAGSIEIAQVRTTASGAAPITAGEIYQTVGAHQERYDYPVWSEDPIRGQITFAAPLDAIHAGGTTKKVCVRAATPIFAEIPRARDWVPAETSNSVNSEQYYDGTIGSFSSSLNQASFTVSMNDGVTDALLAKKGQNLLFKFKPDKNKAPYQVTQGVLGVSRTFGVGANPSASVTVSASQASVDFAS